MKTLEANKHKQSGFTIIELVIVILVIGILSAVALPRMIDLSTQARKSVILAITGNFSTSVELLRSQWIAEGKNNVVKNFDGTFFFIGTASGNGAVQNVAVSGTDDTAITPTTVVCTDLWNKLLRNPPKALADSTCLANRTCKFEITYATNMCTYTDRDSNYISYDISTGIVSSNDVEAITLN